MDLYVTLNLNLNSMNKQDKHNTADQQNNDNHMATTLPLSDTIPLEHSDSFGDTPPMEDTLPLEHNDSFGDTIPLEDTPPLKHPYPLDDTIPLDPECAPRKTTFYRECPIAGWKYHHPEDFWEELYEGIELALVRDNNNPHDKNAVAVAFVNDYDGDPEDFDFDNIIGYVPKSENGVIAQLMDMGWDDIFTAKITTVKNEGPADQRLRMTIYMQSKEKENRDPIFFAMEADQEQLQYIETDLYAKGYTYCRWGGFPIWHNLLPCEKDKVAVITKDGNGATLYLLHCLAKGDNVRPFIDDIEELYRCDDCLPFILTNIKGPIRASLNDIAFLEHEDIGEMRPNILISSDSVAQLKKLFQ